METAFHLGHKECQNVPAWFDDKFWNDLPNPSDTHTLQHQHNGSVPTPITLPSALKSLQNHKEHTTIAITIDKSGDIKRRYFIEWKTYARKSKEEKDDLLKRIEQEKKLINFLDTLNEHKQKLKDIQKQVKPNIKYSQSTNCYENRFEAQQNIIEIQKLKLAKQEKIIEQLKLNKLNEEINRSIEETEKDIKQAFLKCTSKSKAFIHPILQSLPNPDTIPLHPTSNKAPKIIQEMESRALQREEKRQIILQRKKILEQKRKEALLMEIENKKVLDEQMRKENLIAIKERREKELEHQQKIRIKKHEFFEKCRKADCCYKQRLKVIGFTAFSRIIIIKQNNILKSEVFYETHLKRKHFNNWTSFISDIYNTKYSFADNIYNLKLFRNIFSMWFNMYVLSIQNLQVAEDLYEMQLQSKIFIHWHRYTCKQYVLHTKNLQKVQKHYNSRILLHYFYQWRSLPAVLKIEKAKEAKKQRWREKVWEILPDFNPTIDDV